MLSKSSYKIFLSALWCIFLYSAILNGQSYRFKTYGPNENIPSEFVYTIVQDDNGYLWVGTGNGLAKFDGFEFYNISLPDQSPGRYPTSSIKDKNGNLWFGCSDGSVFYTSGNTLKQVQISNSRAISAMLEGPDQLIYIIPQGVSIFAINPDDPEKVRSYSVDPGFALISACFTKSGDLLLGTQENICVCRINGDAFSIISKVEGFDYYSIKAIHRINDQESFLIGTNGSGIFRLDFSQGNGIVTRFANKPELEILDVEAITEDLEKNLWLCTNGSGVIQINISDTDGSVKGIKYFDENSGLPGSSVKVVYEDLEKNYWFGLFGRGLAVINSLSFSIYSPGTISENTNIIYINKLHDDYFLGTPEGYFLLDLQANKPNSFVGLKKSTGQYEISSYCIDSDNNLWIGTNGGGLYVRNAAGNIRRFYHTGNSGQDKINDVEADKKNIWLATLNGVIILDKYSGDSTGGYNIYNGLPHNSINRIFLMKDGRAAIAMKADRLYIIDPEIGVIPGKAIMTGTNRNEILSFCQTSDGHLWACTLGNGIFEFFNDSLRSYSRAEMLMSDFCYSILADSIDRIWVGHAPGFSRYNSKTGVMRSYGADFTKGGYCNPDALYESSDGKIFIGTTKGFILYDRRKDYKPRTEPINNINYISINDSVYPLKHSYLLPYKKRYNIIVHYVGINLKDPDKVVYQTILENYDDRWSTPTTQREVRYAPGEGRYRFMMRSVNEDGLSKETPVSFDLYIKKPFWRAWWFIFTFLTMVSLIVIFIVRQREKAQKKIREYLEKELEARTRVVLKQKDKIELQNIEITDSINYAKRIQTSILPDTSKLKETFSDAFLLFRPRDIVSGDFYWFDKFSDDKFILVCADSTGHGVPGAFMSMIGSTLLQDIITRQRISKPSEVLKLLDKQIFSTLNQNVELGVSNDGMDMVVCEIDVKKRHIRFASAMRPVILVLDNEPLYIKGNRCSVGGESVIEKYFDDQEYYLGEGDTLYLFSDGLPDQFGGTDGKKMKIARLKKLIEDVSSLSLSGQKEVIMKFYDEWKGEYDQVDDILLIGVRL